MRAWMVAMASLAGCGTIEVICPPGEVACGSSCVTLQSDAANCSACGRACQAGEACQAGACTTCAEACTTTRGCAAGVCQPDAYVACFATSQVRAVAADLAPVGSPLAVDKGPVSMAALAGKIWVSHSLQPPTVVGLGAGDAAPTRFTLGGEDLEMIRAANELLLVSNSRVSNLVVVDPKRGVVDDVPLSRSPGVYENPRGIAAVGSAVYVALYGTAEASASFDSGQAIALVNVAGSAACATPPCARVVKRLSLDAPGACDAPGLPFPSGAVAMGKRVFVALSNLKLKKSPFGDFFTDPAGHGKLAVVDTANGDALSFVDLGASCTNPGAVAANGSTVWVACGGTMTVVPVDVSGIAPVVGAAVSPGVVSGGLAFCGGWGYVTDQYSGKVVRFDPAGVQPLLTADVCPLDPTAGFALASDVACAP